MNNMEKSCYLDANILTNYTSIAYQHFHDARKVIVGLIQEEITPCISPLCIDELLYATKKTLTRAGYKSCEEQLEKALMIILNIPKLKIINPPTSRRAQRQVLKLMKKFKLDPRDAYHLLAAKHNNVDYFETLDSDFNKVFKDGYIKKFS